MNIRITNLSRKATENDLAKLFKEFGEILSVAVVTDSKTGKSKGFAFIEMQNKSEGLKAISSLNKTKFMGEKLTVKEVN